MQMVFAYFGVRTSQRALLRILKTTELRGTRNSALVRAAVAQGLYHDAHDNATLAQIRQFMKLNKPVIVSYLEPSDDEGHYAVVTGYERGKIILNDPQHGKNFRISDRRFLARWHDRWDTKHHRWMLVLSKGGR